MTPKKKTFQTFTFNLDMTTAAWSSGVVIVEDASQNFTIINKTYVLKQKLILVETDIP